MNKTFNFVCIQILFIVYFLHIDFFKVYAEDFEVQKNKMDKLMEELHSMYMEAFDNEKTFMTRRLYTKDGNSHYTLHVQKLKEVNGIKTHNLKVVESTKKDSPIIYINNPVEAGMPNPFLSLYEFKHVLRERIENQKKEFDPKRKIIINALNKNKVNYQLNNVTNKIFDVKKYIELIINNSTKKPMMTITHKRLNKRKPKVNVMMSNFTPVQFIVSTPSSKKLNRRKPKVNVMMTNFTPVQFIVSTPSSVNKKRLQKKHVGHTLPSMISDKERTIVDERTVKTVVDKESTIDWSGDGELPTEKPSKENIITELTAVDQITTVEVAKEEIITGSVTEKETATGSATTVTETVSELATAITEKETVSESATTITEKEAVTEPATTVIEKETVTEATTTTTTTTAKPITTRRTRQKKPYVFMGNPDTKTNNDN